MTQPNPLLQNPYKMTFRGEDGYDRDIALDDLATPIKQQQDRVNQFIEDEVRKLLPDWLLRWTMRTDSHILRWICGITIEYRQLNIQRNSDSYSVSTAVFVRRQSIISRLLRKEGL